MKQVAATEVSASQISEIAGFSFVDAVHISDDIGALKTFNASVIPSRMSSSIHVEGASVQELKDLAYTPNTYSIADSVQNVLSARLKANGKMVLELTAPAPAPVSLT